MRKGRARKVCASAGQGESQGLKLGTSCSFASRECILHICTCARAGAQGPRKCGPRAKTRIKEYWTTPMCIPISVYIYIYIYICSVSISNYISIHIVIHMYIHVCIHTYVHICLPYIKGYISPKDSTSDTTPSFQLFVD